MDEPTDEWIPVSDRIKVSAPDAAALQRDAYLYGAAYIFVDEDLIGHRIAPEDVSPAEPPA